MGNHVLVRENNRFRFKKSFPGIGEIKEESICISGICFKFENIIGYFESCQVTDDSVGISEIRIINVIYGTDIPEGDKLAAMRIGAGAVTVPGTKGQP